MSKYASVMVRALQKFIVNQGELVSCYRNSSKTTQVSYAQCQPLTIEQASKYDLQGADNTDNFQPHLFVFPPLVDIRVGDVITYASNPYRVVSAIPNRMEGNTINIECVGVRQ